MTARNVPLALLASLLLPGSLSLAGCSQAADGPEEADVEEGALAIGQTSYTLQCKGADGAKTNVVIAANGSGFDLKAIAGASVLFQASAQRPSLNVRIEDGSSTDVKEYVDFSDSGLEIVPVDAPKAIEVDLSGAKALLFKDGSTSVNLTCRFNKENLLRFLAFDFAASIDMAGVKAVAFDIDDTLAFSTPSFVRGSATGGTPKPEDTLFWTQTNGCDNGCPEQTITLPDGTTKLLAANEASTPKSKALRFVALHKSKGHKVYAITARPDTNGEPLRDYLEQKLGIARADVFFEPDMDLPGNPRGKTDRIESLDLDVFYGDSDSDITDTAKAFDNGTRKQVKSARFLRSPKSSNRKAGKLNKYHPGYYGETIIRDSYE